MQIVVFRGLAYSISPKRHCSISFRSKNVIFTVFTERNYFNSIFLWKVLESFHCFVHFMLPSQGEIWTELTMVSPTSALREHGDSF